jgi:Zn-dependent M28 family amino/carboxypeptidase
MALAMALGAVGVASAAVPSDSSQQRDAVTVDGILQHERAFQKIADANGDTRASGTEGYKDSADYVAGLLEGAGYNVTRQEFDYEVFIENSDPVLDPTNPDLDAYTPGEVCATMDYSGSGTVEVELQTVGGIVIPSPGGSTSGCSTEDFVDFEAGNIAPIQRGTCPFRDKVENAEAAGAVGVVIFNEGNDDPDDDRFALLEGTLDPPQVDILVVGTTFAVGQELNTLLQQGPVTLWLAVDARVEPRTTKNVIADTTTGRQDRTVVVGSHLDSVAEGPGINDNGSGSATDLEVALQMARLDIQPRNRVRFAFWGAEESGLVGSQYYVDSLTQRQIKDIAVNLNFDMVASPNYVRFVYDGDASDTDSLGSTGSGVVEDVFTDYFASHGLASEPTAFDGRSDYDAFINVGIPAGGLFTGAEDKKTEAEAAIYGGVPGAAYDPCYHQACDSLTPVADGADAETYEELSEAYAGALVVDGTISNLSTQALDEMSDAVAHGTVTFAQTASAVNGTDKGSGAAKSSANKYHGSLVRR